MSDIPPALSARMAELVDEPSAPETYLDAAETLLRHVLHVGCVARASALDLLVVDALVTEAFAVASVEPQLIERRAEAAVRRIAALGGA
jgi:hypothetical protein